MNKFSKSNSELPGSQDTLDQEISELQHQQDELLANIRGFELITPGIMSDENRTEEDKINFLEDNEIAREKAESQLVRISAKLYDLTIQKYNK